MPTHHFYHKGRHRKNKHGPILIGVAVVLITLGISAMLHVNGLYDEGLELHKQSEIGHPLESRDMRRESITTPQMGE